MFWITKDPSSGSDNLYLTEITYNGSNVVIMCVVGVWQHILDLGCVCVCVASDRRNINTPHTASGTTFSILSGKSYI